MHYKITVYTKPDDLGRQSFLAEWPSDTIGPKRNESGLRGQNFFTSLDDFIKREQTKNNTVEIKYELEGPNKFA